MTNVFLTHRNGAAWVAMAVPTTWGHASQRAYFLCWEAHLFFGKTFSKMSLMEWIGKSWHISLELTRLKVLGQNPATLNTSNP